MDNIEGKELDEIGEYMTSPVLKVDADDTVQEAAVYMHASNVGSLIVEQVGDDVGIITERDLSQKVIAQGKDPEQLKVSDIMTSPIISMDRFLPVEEANKFMMKNKIRHLVVTEEDKIVGILSVKDLVAYFTKDHRMTE